MATIRERVFEHVKANSGASPATISKALKITEGVASSALSSLFKLKQVGRVPSGKSFEYGTGAEYPKGGRLQPRTYTNGSGKRRRQHDPLVTVLVTVQWGKNGSATWTTKESAEVYRQLQAIHEPH